MPRASIDEGASEANLARERTQRSLRCLRMSSAVILRTAVCAYARSGESTPYGRSVEKLEYDAGGYSGRPRREIFSREEVFDFKTSRSVATYRVSELQSVPSRSSLATCVRDKAPQLDRTEQLAYRSFYFVIVRMLRYHTLHSV